MNPIRDVGHTYEYFPVQIHSRSKINMYKKRKTSKDDPMFQ